METKQRPILLNRAQIDFINRQANTLGGYINLSNHTYNEIIGPKEEMRIIFTEHFGAGREKYGIEICLRPARFQSMEVAA